MYINNERAGLCPAALALFFWIDNVSPIKVASSESLNKDFGSCNVSCNWNIVLIAQANYLISTGQINIAGGVAEEQDKVDLVICNPCADLLVAALIAGQVICYGQTCRLGHEMTCSICSTDFVT